mmetsp:Transcript_6160/g.15236  ORF Transcript_6160/g.15236 Transcript_6160/m.15236 type:complete len:125 (+) Transcript_6160:282-656(+)
MTARPSFTVTNTREGSGASGRGSTQPASPTPRFPRFHEEWSEATATAPTEAAATAAAVETPATVSNSAPQQIIAIITTKVFPMELTATQIGTMNVSQKHNTGNTPSSNRIISIPASIIYRMQYS